MWILDALSDCWQLLVAEDGHVKTHVLIEQRTELTDTQNSLLFALQRACILKEIEAIKSPKRQARVRTWLERATTAHTSAVKSKIVVDPSDLVGAFAAELSSTPDTDWLISIMAHATKRNYRHHPPSGWFSDQGAMSLAAESFLIGFAAELGYTLGHNFRGYYLKRGSETLGLFYTIWDGDDPIAEDPEDELLVVLND